MSFKSGIFALAILPACLLTIPAGLALAENCGETLLARGEFLHGQGNVDQVVEVYATALETCEMTREMTAHIYARRGIANFSMARYAEAAADYTQSLAFSTERPMLILMKRASAYLGAGENALALADLDEAIGQDPERGALYLMRMDANQQLGNHQAVEADFQLIEAQGNMSTQWQAYKFMGLDPEALTQ